ncbi:hypothetical protein RclHR1_05670008 [Rhizophagus clarus]|uniref:Galactose oxidase n=1 Tax=Rhizophagus clarus TaxID=94130 RepID=A0A2Z6RNN7_9GLOM|nr:hypothetical protein RclHR1_05670008 [Rhizophagus clarus]GES82043.1 hypothetical protein GLOIN_2v1470408 [Rhizophagus clarus]
MLRNSLVCFTILWILLQVLVEVNCQMTPFKPSVYYGHTATFIDNKLYISSGSNINQKQVKEFFYLDVSVPFNTQELPWQDLSNINMVPPNQYATSVKGGPNNDTLFFYGGFTTDQTMALVYTFDSQSIVWSIPKITGVNTVRKYGLTAIINNDGRMYLWSGATTVFYGMITIYADEMLILDTINLSWSQGSLVNAPIPRCDYGAALLPNNKIIYIGGSSDPTTIFDAYTLNIRTGSALTLNEVYIYDTINDNWDTKVTSGKIPSNRAGFSTVLGLDGQRIIIFGGYFIYPGYLDTTLYVLDLNDYNWYIPKISGNIPNPRVYHDTNVVGKYMVISFGSGGNRAAGENDILLLDISNNDEYVWTTMFDPSVPKNNTMPSPSLLPPSPPPSPPSPSPSLSSLPSSSNNSNNTTGIVLGSLLSGILLSVGGFLIYKWNKNKQNQKTIYRNENYHNYNPEEKELPIERDIHNYEQAINNNNEQEIVQIPRNKNTINYESIMIPPSVINKNIYHKQEIILAPETNHELIITQVNDFHGQEIKDENATNYEPTIIPANNHDQEIIQIHQNENHITNHEPITPAPVIINTNNYNYEQEIISTSNNTNRLLSQILKDEILQAVKQEIGQNLKNEILQAIKEENFNNFNIAKDNTRLN